MLLNFLIWTVKTALKHIYSRYHQMKVISRRLNRNLKIDGNMKTVTVWESSFSDNKGSQYYYSGNETSARI